MTTSMCRPAQVLFSLKQPAFDIAVAGARAQLAQAVLDINSAKRGYAEALAGDRAAASADRAGPGGSASLCRRRGQWRGTRETYDNANFKLQSDQSRLAQMQDAAGLQLAKLSGNADIRAEDTPEYQNALANLNNALREQRNSVAKAPFAGYVTEVISCSRACSSPPAPRLSAWCRITIMWVAAQPKENDLTFARDGQPVTMTIDTYPGESWNGTVESIFPATDQEFSILPAENSSGNWVKVVQRVPVRVNPLRPRRLAAVRWHECRSFHQYHITAHAPDLF